MSSCLDLLPPDLPVAITAAVLVGVLLVTLRVWQMHRFPGRPAFLIAHLAMLWWLFASMMELCRALAARCSGPSWPGPAS